MATRVEGPHSWARWVRCPWLVPRNLSSWVFWPHLVVSRYAPEESNRLHILHELAHVYQIERDGYLRCVWRTLRHLFKQRESRPLEIEARMLAAKWYNEEVG